MSTNADLEKRMEKYEEAQGRQGEILAKLTTLVEAFTARITAMETDGRTVQTTLIEIGKAMVRYEERDASTQKWVNVVAGVFASLVVGVAMFALGYYIHH